MGIAHPGRAQANGCWMELSSQLSAVGHAAKGCKLNQLPAGQYDSAESEVGEVVQPRWEKNMACCSVLCHGWGLVEIITTV